MKNRSLKIFTTILSVLACFGLLPQMQALLPPEIPGNPDGCYPAFNTAEGCNALHFVTGGIGDTGMGWFSLFLANNASFNTGVGAGALAVTARVAVAGTVGNDNSAVGAGAMLLNTGGQDNSAVGTNALLFNANGGDNNAVGSFALHNNDDGFFNNAVGRDALFDSDADQNNAFGDEALFHNIGGFGNVAIGDSALFLNVSGSQNVAVGRDALFSNTADFNVAVGALSLVSNTSGNGNAAVGWQSLEDNVTGADNTAVGFNAMRLGSSTVTSVAVGTFAAENNDDSGNGTADFNTAVGGFALRANVNGTRNTAVGAGAMESANGGSDNTAVGELAGNNLGTGSSNIDIGSGVTGVLNENNTIRIGTNLPSGAGLSQAFMGGIVSTVQSGAGIDFVTIRLADGRLGRLISSRRYKHDIQPMDTASKALYQLKPVTFHYNKEVDPEQGLDYGLIAEDVAKVAPELAVRNPEGEIQNVRYQAINAMMLNEFLKEHKKVQEQQATITQLKKDFGATIAQLTARLDEQAAQIQKVSAQLEASKPAPQVVANKP